VARSVLAGPADDLVVGPNAIFTAGFPGDSGHDHSAASAGVEPFSFGLKARRTDNSLLMGLGGNALSECSVHGPSATVDFTTEVGNNPMPDIQCGRAFGMTVDLHGCRATLEFHGFMHSDRPTRIYLGMMTADITFEKTGANTGKMTLTLFTPKAPLVLRGTVSTPTPIIMTTCPI